MSVCDHGNKMKTFTLCYIAINSLKIMVLKLIPLGGDLNVPFRYL
ncbi:hypothetical protein O23A_p3917 [Aeromonas salmonicida]|nr:hypothetical protein O23A_p3917 [Aeromonas salmonicida]